MTPPVAASVATSLTVLAPPIFCAPNATVTVSPGSITPFAGVKLSLTSVAPAAARIGDGARHRLTVAVAPLVTVTLPEEAGGKPATSLLAVTVYVPGATVIEYVPAAPVDRLKPPVALTEARLIAAAFEQLVMVP